MNTRGRRGKSEENERERDGMARGAVRPGRGEGRLAKHLQFSGTFAGNIRAQPLPYEISLEVVYQTWMRDLVRRSCVCCFAFRKGNNREKVGEEARRRARLLCITKEGACSALLFTEIFGQFQTWSVLEMSFTFDYLTNYLFVIIYLLSLLLFIRLLVTWENVSEYFLCYFESKKKMKTRRLTH